MEPDSLVAFRAAPEPMGTLSLERSLALAVAHHPSLRDAAWQLRAASARRRDAGRRPNPSASLELENVGGSRDGDAHEATARLSQTLELGGDRRARAGTAQAAEQLARSELTSGEREVVAQVTERFFEAWTLQERLTRLADAERLAERSIAVAAERLRVGAGPALEQTRAEAAVALRHAERIRTAADLAASRQRLASSWGSMEARFDSLELPAPRRHPIPPPARLYALLEDHPRRQRAAAEVALEEARWREARAERVPDLELSGGVRRLAAQEATTFLVGLTMPLPLWNAQAGSVAASEAEHRAATARSELVALDLRAAVRSAYERYLAAIESHELIASRVVPKSHDVLLQLGTGYRSGRFSSLEYIDGQRSLLDAELQLVEATAEAWRARLALERLLGRSVEDLVEEGGR